MFVEWDAVVFSFEACRISQNVDCLLVIGMRQVSLIFHPSVMYLSAPVALSSLKMCLSLSGTLSYGKQFDSQMMYNVSMQRVSKSCIFFFMAIWVKVVIHYLEMQSDAIRSRCSLLSLLNLFCAKKYFLQITSCIRCLIKKAFKTEFKWIIHLTR